MTAARRGTGTAVEAALTYMATTEDLRRVSEHLFLDQQTLLPPAATDDRARQIGLLERMIRDRLAADEFGALLDAVQAERPDVPWLAAARRDLDRERLRPAAAQQAFASVGIQANTAWKRAREEDDWGAFAPWLARMVEINLEVAAAVGYAEHPHDALLSLYDPGPTTRELDTLFDRLRPDLVGLSRDRPLVEVPESPVVPTGTLLAISRDVALLLGFDLDRGALAISPHGYTNPGGPNDIRVTFRDDRPVAATLGTVLHELGHALYEQGIDPELWGTAAGRGVMPYLHESQSKFWENIVGRRRDLMPALADILTAHLGPDVPGCSAEELYHLQVHSPASMIRTESDEVSFNLHILLRWEVERGLLSGGLSVDEVPELWAERSREFFGRPPRDFAEGPLQDPHWCRRYMGLFTSYVVGNLASAQMAEQLGTDGVDLATAVEGRDLAPVLGWLRREVHGPGRSLPMTDLLVRATGRPLDAEPYRRHLTGRYAVA
ncbi:MAG TPA: hypothetical protein VGC57_13010 [Cellulomonas sp.]